MAYTNSSLANVTLLSPNHSGQRTHTIDTITIHCFVAQVTAKRGCEVFQPKDKEASCNYVVGYDGSIGLCVEEKNRSWCTSSNSNDQRAITIEVASDNKEPYAVTDKAYNALIELVTDICRRNGIAKLKWSTNKNERMNHLNGCNMTVHRDYANKSCPGKYLYDRHGDIAAKVNAKLEADKPTPAPQPTTGGELKVGDIVNFKGTTHYRSSYAGAAGFTCEGGKAKVTVVNKSGAHPYHLVAVSGGGSTVYGWVNASDIEGQTEEKPWTPAVGDTVIYNGTTHYTSANASAAKSCKGGKAKITQIYQLGKSKHPYHLVRVSGSGATVYGWVNAGTFTKS